MHSPVTPNGASIVRSPTPGPTLFVKALFKDRSGRAVPGAEVDVWQSSPEGYYENQDPVQAEMNLRGKFITDEDGHIRFRSREAGGLSNPGRRPGRRFRCVRRAATTCGPHTCICSPARMASRR